MHLYELDISFQSGVCLIVGVAILYWISKTIYNLYFHPLRNFPGPKLAAIGCEYEFYHDVVKDGRYLWKMEEMHRKYGQFVHQAPPQNDTITDTQAIGKQAPS